jgi:hypothetical protein
VSLRPSLKLPWLKRKWTGEFTEKRRFQWTKNGLLSSFNRKLLLFSGIFVACSFGATKLFGSLGFYIANSINMSLRVCQSVYLIHKVFADVDVNPFVNWFPRRSVGASFLLSFIWILVIMVRTSIFAKKNFGDTRIFLIFWEN